MNLWYTSLSSSRLLKRTHSHFHSHSLPIYGHVYLHDHTVTKCSLAHNRLAWRFFQNRLKMKEPKCLNTLQVVPSPQCSAWHWSTFAMLVGARTVMILNNWKPDGCPGLAPTVCGVCDRWRACGDTSCPSVHMSRPCVLDSDAVGCSITTSHIHKEANTADRDGGKLLVFVSWYTSCCLS